MADRISSALSMALRSANKPRSSGPVDMEKNAEEALKAWAQRRKDKDSSTSQLAGIAGRIGRNIGVSLGEKGVPFMPRDPNNIFNARGRDMPADPMVHNAAGQSVGMGTAAWREPREETYKRTFGISPYQAAGLNPQELLKMSQKVARQTTEGPANMVNQMPAQRLLFGTNSDGTWKNRYLNFEGR